MPDLRDVFVYHKPSPEQVEAMQAIRDKAFSLASDIEALCPPCADRSAAIRKVREATFTANAAIILDGRV